MGEEEIKKQIRSYYGENGRGKYVKWVLILLFVLAAGFFAYTFLAGSVSKDVCGDGICGSAENCWDCPKDCPCSSGEYCSEEAKLCIKPSCGNGECEPGESIENCCDDCGCSTEEKICNKQTHKCEIPEPEISDQRVEELVKDFLEEKNMTGLVVKVGDKTLRNGKTGKFAYAFPQNETDWHNTLIFVVTDDEEVHFIGAPI